MEHNVDFIQEQYAAVRSSRQALLAYCATIVPADLLHENGSFGRGGSIRNLLVHIGNVYEFWIAKNALGKNIPFTEYASKNNVADIIRQFDSIDLFMQDFMEMFRHEPAKEIAYTLDSGPGSTTITKLFTHVITHEFHHKGQILSMGRHLGYIPVDTDIIR